MLNLHTSNRLEDLAEGLVGAETDLHPLEPRIVVTETASLGRWVTQRFCLRRGIACLVETPLPAACLWQLARRVLGLPPGEDPLSRERMQWLLHAALGETSVTDAMPEIAGYLEKDDTGLKRWQLAGRIADCFDRYQYFRPERIRQWSDGGESDWQARLWRVVSGGVEDHRVALMDRFLGALRAGTLPSNLPRRLDLFSVHGLPRLLLDAYAAASRHLEVHLWLLAPTPEYWADLASPRAMARKRMEAPDEVILWQAGNPLLTQWGRQGQEFQDMLLTLQDDCTGGGTEDFTEPSRSTLLGCVQSDIFRVADENADRPETLSDADSIEFHVCHSPMRECQVLRDRLLQCLQEDPALQPEDILVMVPEISRYAPYIEAVFAHPRDDGSPWLPFNLSDVVQADEHPLIRAFLDLLRLPDSRFTRSDVLGLVTLPEVQRRFGLDPGDGAALEELFGELHVYWGLDGRDKQARFDLPAIDDNTWRHAFQRVMAGFALGEVEEVDGIAPQPGMTATEAGRAARLFDLLDTLRRWMRTLDRPATVREWAERLARLAGGLFEAGGDDEDHLARINETIEFLLEVGEQVPETAIPLPVIRQWLAAELGTHADRGRFYSGGVTFCGMKPLRGVPFSVIALLGMQDQTFPRRRRAAAFDLMARGRRHGDPDPVQEDRYLFLETLLAARQRLIVSYVGRDIRSNDTREPSVLVRELQDYLDERYRGAAGAPLSTTLTREHPLQPFGLERGEAGPAPRFDARWLEMARVITRHALPRRDEHWPSITLPGPRTQVEELALEELIRFFRNPVRHFVQHGLKLYDPRENDLPEDEAFELDFLQQWQLADRLLAWSLEGEADRAEARFRARGLLPHGALAGPALEKTAAAVSRIAGFLPEGPLMPEPLDVDLPLQADGWERRLVGRVHRRYADHGLVHLSPSGYRIASVLPLWIEHLVLAAGGKACASRFACKDRFVRIGAIGPRAAKKTLERLVGCYLAGLQQPLCLPPKTASAWFQSRQKHPDVEKAAKAAEREWCGNYMKSGEREDFYLQVLLRGSGWQPDDTLADTARAIFQPLQDAIEEDRES